MKIETPSVRAATLAILALASPQWAAAEETFRQTQGVTCLADGSGCATFQGYIYVHRDGGDAAQAPLAGGVRGNSKLSERRLYLHVGSEQP